MSDTVIVAEKISKIYRLYDKPTDRLKETFSIRKKNYHKEVYALKDVSFEIKQGETVGIIGRNGSGKSTLLKILTGVLNPSMGQITINGKVSALLELGAGFNMEYTGIENIYLNAAIMNIPKEVMDSRLQSILDFADIGEYVYQPCKTYSSGMFVRLAFAVAIHVDPDILIVDEALAVGDTRFQLKCMDKFVEFMNAGKTVLFVSHDVNAIKRFCKRSIWINQGNLIMDGETNEVTDRYMDFLKSGEKSTQLNSTVNLEEVESEIALKEAEQDGGEEPECDKTHQLHTDIAEISSVNIKNKNGDEISEILHGEKVNIEVQYYVNETEVHTPVLGVSVRTIDDKYVCGLNTLLDQTQISWDRGTNQVTLTYDNFLLTGGSYYLDVAVFDKTATVPIDYQARIKEFVVKMDYIAEGVVVLPHRWNNGKTVI